MPRPEPQMIGFTIDGREVRAPENAMLVDAAKYGDVEIPVFCYEPKLGNPVGACRMCLVEIEGIPKLQTGCSTPVKDGMVVDTQSERVRTAQEAVVEFLLINHPLDCPVCDKGGECPLQDISFGWGGGVSRFIEPKRHFRKPLELSPLVAIDRERCILCYRCVRFSQEIAEDYQLVLLERGAHSYVATFDGHPYVAPFSGNIIELCPVGALTSRPYRFRARPWDIEGAGSVCALCPAQCNVTFTVRDERVLRVLGRDHEGVDDGWLCDKGRFAYQAIHVDERITTPMVRDGGRLRPVSWERALEEAAAGLRRARGRVGALVGGQTTNEEGFLLSRLLREGLDSPDVDSTGGLDPTQIASLLDPEVQATVSDLEFAHTVLVLGTEPVDDAPILDLRIRKGVRRNRARLAVAGPRPSSLDANAAVSIRYPPGGESVFLAALARALDGGDVEAALEGSGQSAAPIRELAEMLRDGGATTGPTPSGPAPHDVVILWGEQLLRAAPPADGAPGSAALLLELVASLSLRGRDGAGLLGIPSHTNGRGLLEAGVAPGLGGGFTEGTAGRGAPEIGQGLVDGELTALYLMHDDPLRSQLDRALWEAALDRASVVVAHAAFVTEAIREHATVVFPAESYAEKEGTLTHPDGRLQRLRPAIARQGETRAEWSVIADLARRLDLDLGVQNGPMATAQLVQAVPFYAGITLEEIGGRGVRWQERPAAEAYRAPATGAPEAPAATGPSQTDEPSDRHPSVAGALRLGTFRSVWAAPEVEVSPSLRFLAASQMLEISPSDVERLGLRGGEQVEVVIAGANGSSPARADGATPAGANGHGAHAGRHDELPGHVRATVAPRAAVPEGTVFLQTGIPEHSANALGDGGGPVLVEILRTEEPIGALPVLGPRGASAQ